MVQHQRSCPLLLALFLMTGCSPSPEVLRSGAGRAIWDPSATKSPPPSDAEEISEPPPGEAEPDADIEVTPDARVLVVADAGSTGGGLDGAARDASPPSQGPPQTCTLTFQVTTATANGSYAPRNCGAIWVTDANGRFVKSLNVWAQKRIRHLVTWQASAMGNTVDAVTSATVNSHGTRMAKWNCTGVDHQPVADGTYRINAEMTERNGLGRVMMPLEFVKRGTDPVMLTAPDQSSFKGIRLQVSAP
jgi:hypothetical protein